LTLGGQIYNSRMSLGAHRHMQIHMHMHACMYGAQDQLGQQSAFEMG